LSSLNLVTHAYPTYAQALVGRSSQLAFLDRMGNNVLVTTALRFFPGLENRLGLARDRLAETQSPPMEPTNARMTVEVGTDSGPTKHVRLRATYTDRGTCVVGVPQNLMDHDERPLMAAYSWNGSGDPQTVVLDFSQVQRINGLGASMLVKFAARAAAKGQNLSAVGVSPDLGQVFQVTELDRAMGIGDSQAPGLLTAGTQPKESATDTPPAGLHNLTNWAKPTPELFVPDMPREARNLNVNGRRAVGPVNGFGWLCQKVFRLHLEDPGISPEQAIAALKVNFPGFQPSFNRFYASPAGIQPGEIVLIDSSTPGGPVSTGVMVMYADDRSFTFNTPQGHPECGFVSFSAHEGRRGPMVQIVGLARASDPIFEAAFRMVGSTIQTRIWTHVLRSLAMHFGVPAHVTCEQECIDRRLRWSQIGNLAYNAQIRTLINEPKRWFASA